MIEKNTNEKKPIALSTWEKVKKKVPTILMVLVFGLLIFSPDAKSFLIKQLLFTGIFNAEVSSVNSTDNELKNHFDFEDYEGNIKNTADLKGKVVFINFWASWCPPCIAEFPSIEKFHSKFKNNDKMVFLMINMDDDIKIGQQFYDKKNYSLPIAQATSAVPKEIYSGSLPTSVILDKNGIVRMRHTGFANYDAKNFHLQIEKMLAE
ncbi:redoxin family protein [Flavobacterium sp. TMP13]|uniref:TlpA family protein disulfide reductase n=1 Tax=Flavobacterium sp. TMP13 TaxID=3425950 RepID=UPI003D788ED8